MCSKIRYTCSGRNTRQRTHVVIELNTFSFWSVSQHPFGPSPESNFLPEEASSGSIHQGSRRRSSRHGVKGRLHVHSTHSQQKSWVESFAARKVKEKTNQSMTISSPCSISLQSDSRLPFEPPSSLCPELPACKLVLSHHHCDEFSIIMHGNRLVSPSHNLL